MPTISVMIPVYNGEQYIKECLDSLINQTYADFEIVVVNDGSTDNTRSIVEEYVAKDSRVLLVNQENQGLSAARNRLLKESHSDLLTYVDADDWCDPDYLEYLLNIQQETQADIVACNHYIVTERGKNSRFKCVEGVEKLTTQDSMLNILYHEAPDVSAWGKLYKRHVFKGVEYPNGRLFEDTYVIVSLLNNSKVLGMGYEPKYYYRYTVNSISKQVSIEHYFDFVSSVNHMIDLMNISTPEMLQGSKRRVCHAALSTLRLNCRDEKPNTRELITCIRINAIAVLKDSRAPKRDKIGVLSALMGATVYKQIWKLYNKFRKSY